MTLISLPLARPTGSTHSGVELADSLAHHIAVEARPRTPTVHLVREGSTAQLLVVDSSQLYQLSTEIAARIDSVIETGDEAALSNMLFALGLAAPGAIDDSPLESPPVHALSLAVAQKCNLGCTYCYAQQGSFGGAAKNMSLETARHAVDLLLTESAGQKKVNLTFLGGEPLANRTVLRQSTEYATQQAAERDLEIQFSITTNGTLVTPDDADFFEQHGFAVTISLDGGREAHNQLRPFKNGTGSFDLILERIKPLLERQRRMQVSARVTVTPHNLDLPQTLNDFIALGFHTVGFSPLLRAPNGRNEMDQDHLAEMLAGMIACGLNFERHVLGGQRYPFINMVNALRELHRGTHRPYPCGAGAGYFGVSAEGELAACHRFVDDPLGSMGNLKTGIDRSRQNAWLAERHVHFQEPCNSCWARYMCGGGCHHEVLARGRSACDFIRGWLHYTVQAHGRLSRLAPNWFEGGTFL
jgi:uncharacterized protein